MSNPVRPDDDFRFKNDIDRRLKELENSVARITEQKAYEKQRIAAVNLTTIPLGSFDGENILGVRIAMHGVLDNGALTQRRVWLRANGINPMFTSWAIFRHFWPSGGPATSDMNGTQLVNNPGVCIGQTDWVAGANMFVVDGTFFTSRNLAGTPDSVRSWLGQYGNRDQLVDGHNILGATIHSQWSEVSTAVSSLEIIIEGNGFSGQVAAEII